MASINNDDDFLNSINDDRLRVEYNRLLSKAFKSVRRRHKTESKYSKSKYEQKISVSENHDDLVSMSIFPFIQRNELTETGYNLRVCDPLHELGIENFDALLAKEFRKNIVCIFVEAKTGEINSGIINEIKKKQRLCNLNKEYIRINYLDGIAKPLILEYVLSVNAMSADDAFNQISAHLNTNTNSPSDKIIIWKSDIHFSQIGIVDPGNHQNRINMLHADTDLNRKLHRIKTSRVALGFYPQSHIVTKMKHLLSFLFATKVLTKRTEFTIREIDNYLIPALYYFKEDKRIIVRSQLLRSLSDIGFIQARELGKFEVTKEYSGGSMTEKTIENLWIKHQLARQLEEEMDKARNEVRNSINQSMTDTTRLDDFPHD